MRFVLPGASRRSLRKILLASLTLGSTAGAHARDPIDEKAVARALAKLAHLGCDARLTPNQKLATRRRGPFGTFELRLMNEVLLPVTARLRARTLTLDAADVRRAAQTFAPRAHRAELRADLRRLGGLRDADAAYLGRVNFGDDTTLRGSFTAHNEAVMTRLTRAVTVFHAQHRRAKVEFRDVLDAGGDVLDAHSYSHRDLDEILDFADLTILHAAALLTAEPVGNLGVDEVLARVMAPHRRRQGLMNRLSLTAPPGLVPELGQVFYVKDTLTTAHGELKFSPAFDALLARRNLAFAARPPHDYESGLGCPVGHRVRGEPRTGVQNVMDAVMHIYRRLEDVP